MDASASIYCLRGAEHKQDSKVLFPEPLGDSSFLFSLFPDRYFGESRLPSRAAIFKRPINFWFDRLNTRTIDIVEVTEIIEQAQKHFLDSAGEDFVIGKFRYKQWKY